VVEAGQRQHHLAVERNLAADEAGVAALGDDRRRRLVGELKDRRNLLDGAGAHHQRRAAVIEPAAFDEEDLLLAWIGDGVARAHDRGEARDQLRRQQRADMGVHGANIVDFVAMETLRRVCPNTRVIPGRRAAANPESRRRCRVARRFWIPGSRKCAPRNDGEGLVRAKCAPE
jgi:hypothetical protein